jgi:ArsR family transcriptional regulator, arsenate/arsenite/antimonite-responsive transcriptional repressor
MFSCCHEVVVKDVAQFLKVLADEARLKMLWLLFNHRELCVCDLMEALGITQSKASRHLATLRHAGLVVDRKEAAWSYYSICPADNDLERALLNTLRAKLALHPDAARVLRSLHTWLERKERDAACAPGDACGPSTRGRSTNRARAARSGVNP